MLRPGGLLHNGRFMPDIKKESDSVSDSFFHLNRSLLFTYP